MTSGNRSGGDCVIVLSPPLARVSIRSFYIPKNAFATPSPLRRHAGRTGLRGRVCCRFLRSCSAVSPVLHCVQVDTLVKLHCGGSRTWMDWLLLNLLSSFALSSACVWV